MAYQKGIPVPAVKGIPNIDDRYTDHSGENGIPSTPGGPKTGQVYHPVFKQTTHRADSGRIYPRVSESEPEKTTGFSNNSGMLDGAMDPQGIPLRDLTMVYHPCRTGIPSSRPRDSDRSMVDGVRPDVGMRFCLSFFAFINLPISDFDFPKSFASFLYE